METFLTPNSELAFLDFPKPRAIPKGHAQCPVCKGHGGWNLRPSAYRLPASVKNTAENRHKYVHFQASCNQCNGWGHLLPEDAKCIHEWVHDANLGRCYNRYKCKKCGKTENVDSSD